MGARTGSLTPGKRADVILLRAGDPNLSPPGPEIAATLVGCAHRGNVDTVIVDGRVVKRSGKLVGFDVPAIRTALEDTARRLAG
jgi:cytosine/adenosine deaminase-related metal-dependent hydrolase